MSLNQLQKQSGRNLVLSANSQATYNEVMASEYLTRRLQFEDSSVMEKDASRRSDYKDVGKGTEFATNTQIIAWDTKDSIKKEADAWLMGWMLAFIFGTDTVTGSEAPYTHTFTFPNMDATMVPTTIYCEETAATATHFKASDMCASSLSLSIPQRGAIMAELGMVGSGLWTPGSIGSLPALPTLLATDYLLGSDMELSITPSGGAATSFIGRLLSATVKIDNNATAFKSVGDGLVAGSVTCGQRKFSLDAQVAALATDDVNGWFESGQLLGVSLATNTANLNQLQLNWANTYLKASKLGNQKDLVIWNLSLDETSTIATSGAPAISASIINQVAAYLAPE